MVGGRGCCRKKRIGFKINKTQCLSLSSVSLVPQTSPFAFSVFSSSRKLTESVFPTSATLQTCRRRLVGFSKLGNRTLSLLGGVPVLHPRKPLPVGRWDFLWSSASLRGHLVNSLYRTARPIAKKLAFTSLWRIVGYPSMTCYRTTHIFLTVTPSFWSLLSYLSLLDTLFELGNSKTLVKAIPTKEYSIS